MEKTDLKRLLGKRIKFLRTRKNFTQEEFSERIGISQRTLSAIECGKSFVTSKTLTNMAAALCVSFDELFKLDYLKDTNSLVEEIEKELQNLKNDREKIEIIYKFIKSFV